MIGRIWALALLFSASSFALLQCGGTVVSLPADGTGGSGGRVGHAGGPSSAAGHGGGGAGSLPQDAGFDEYADPGCPDAGPPSELNECDPFATTPTCLPGEGCYPFVDHPFGQGCGAQSFGTVCMIAGSGRQGQVCGDATGECASGFVCVVGSQPGKHCVKLCLMNDPSSCPRGMICGELDVEGYGVCS